MRVAAELHIQPASWLPGKVGRHQVRGAAIEVNGDTSMRLNPLSAHIVAEQRKLALQYWFYCPFNDWNNKHESDWEMIQLVFDAPTADKALGQTPALVGYSQHEGAESATWDHKKLEQRGGQPVVYPGAGSPPMLQRTCRNRMVGRA